MTRGGRQKERLIEIYLKRMMNDGELEESGRLHCIRIRLCLSEWGKLKNEWVTTSSKWMMRVFEVGNICKVR